MNSPKLSLWLLVVTLTSIAPAGRCIDLLEKYPTPLTAGDVRPNQARPWEFSESDIFQLSHFNLKIEDKLLVETGTADVGLGHCKDGAVWAVIIPRDGGKLTSASTPGTEVIAHVWLRFHPAEINRLFPPDTVTAQNPGKIRARMQLIVGAKFNTSFHAGPNAMIPEPGESIVDVDTVNGPRRDFFTNTKTGSIKYIDAFEERSVKEGSAITKYEAETIFDQLWSEFDRTYAMFELRPEVDWSKLRDKYRPLASECKNSFELATLCAEMLKELRDLHIWLTVDGQDVPVFNRPRAANSNPAAHEKILGPLKKAGNVRWTVTDDQIGYIAIYGWNNDKTAAQCDEAIAQMKNTRGLIVDVRLNGGGSETAAGKFAARFLEKDFVYAYSRYRSGPKHSDLTRSNPRTLSPGGPWRYDRPAIVLIGQKCMSSNESFIAMMTGDPKVTTMGDHTCGSSGNPKMVRLSEEMTVSVPKWIDYLPDRTPLDERGIQPQIRFQPSNGAFEGDHDDLLTEAIERLKKEIAKTSSSEK